MFGMRHSCGAPFGGKWAGGRGWRGRHGWGGRHGSGGRHGWDGDMVRAGRMLAQGDLRLIALALIAEQPRHGYEIIKVLEEKTAGWYSPSPGIVYPTLTYLDANRDFVDAVLERLAAIGEKVARMRRRFGGEDEDRRRMPPLVRAALENLREVAAKRLGDDAEAEAKVVEVLARAAAELKKA